MDEATLTEEQKQFWDELALTKQEKALNEIFRLSRILDKEMKDKEQENGRRN